ncbi:A/G-specific adenine glycosylase [Candidatus Odyssella acanthamoebae]|uniref:A/G-specific adenine glycosylase n=1 Tax=Candidatus Odyssella acanthamoebae TaxID=91604 RepID=UPI00056F8336|nr:A/G-specific adenine glycosylase [Candidatus Paracaedibacter acanthamoebae]
MEKSKFQAVHSRLLQWYDTYQRQLPWRALPGKQPNPYYVLLSEVMLQQTTVVTVIDYFNRFIARWPTLQDLAQADQEELYHQWQGLGYYSRARNLHACIAMIAQQHGGAIPQAPNELIRLPGIGSYTAASIAAIAYDCPLIPVDGNITRVIARLLAMKTPLPDLKNSIFNLVTPLKPTRAGDFAQGLMDLGATVCKPKNPLCGECPLASHCQSHKTNQQHLIPFSKPKPFKPTRYAYAFWCQDEEGFVSLKRRPETGVLANMVGLPTSEWVDDPSSLPSVEPEWIKIPKTIKHTFTHFHLIIESFITKDVNQSNVFKVKPQNFEDYPIPTLMKKVIKTCLNLGN